MSAVSWARICKRLWSPGIDTEESISPTYVAWRASTTNRVLYRPARLRFDTWSPYKIYKYGLWGQPSPSPLWLPHSNPKLWALEAPVGALVHATTSAPMINTSVADPDPNPDPHVFGPPGFGSISQRYGYGSGSGSGSFYHQKKRPWFLLLCDFFLTFYL
jgi:hypothetical protein